MTEPTPAAAEAVDLDAPADDELANALANSEPDADTEDTGTTANSEEAKWRKRFRATEIELTVANARIEQMVRNEIQRVAASTLADGADIWREPVDLADLCDEHGLPDPERVRAHAQTLIDTHRHWAKRGPATPHASAVTSDQTPHSRAGAHNWQEAIRGRTSS